MIGVLNGLGSDVVVYEVDKPCELLEDVEPWMLRVVWKARPPAAAEGENPPAAAVWSKSRLFALSCRYRCSHFGGNGKYGYTSYMNAPRNSTLVQP